MGIGGRLLPDSGGAGQRRPAALTALLLAVLPPHRGGASGQGFMAMSQTLSATTGDAAAGGHVLDRFGAIRFRRRRGRPRAVGCPSLADGRGEVVAYGSRTGTPDQRGWPSRSRLARRAAHRSRGRSAAIPGQKAVRGDDGVDDSQAGVYATYGSANRPRARPAEARLTAACRSRTQCTDLLMVTIERSLGWRSSARVALEPMASLHPIGR